MTRGEAIKDFFCKTILPVAAAALLYCIFRSACVKTGELDYLWLWIFFSVDVRPQEWQKLYPAVLDSFLS